MIKLHPCIIIIDEDQIETVLNIKHASYKYIYKYVYICAFARINFRNSRYFFPTTLKGSVKIREDCPWKNVRPICHGFNNDATFPVNKFLAGTIIFPRVNSEPTKTEGGLYIFFPVCTAGEWPSIYTSLFVFMKSGTDGPRGARNLASARRLACEKSNDASRGASDASGPRPRR